MGFSFVIGTSIYPMCPVGTVSTWLEEFNMIVAQVSGLSYVKTSMKLNVVQSLVEKEVWRTVGKNLVCDVVVK